MKIGTYYYPEQWPREQWKRDFDHIAELGMQIVHMGEFAWFEMEPAPGDIRLDWLSECVEMAHERKLAIILCTPTASPPIWLVQQHPEILPMDASGQRHRFGGRRHYSPTAPAMHDATRRIVTALAERFCAHPSVIGWQIDNEYSGGFDQNDHAHVAFRKWLRERHADIAALNRAWGNQFWNTYYTDFEQILLPPARDARYGNPHHVLDASRFWSRAYADFNKIQADILKSKIGGSRGKAAQFVTTNFMSLHPDADPGDMAADLDLSTWDQYPVYGQEEAPTGESYRMGDPDGITLVHDIHRSYRNRWALMELQPGQVNWARTPNLLYPGAVRLWLWTAFAHGAEFVTTYRYRQPRFGIELFHHGLVGPDGVTPTPGGRQFAQVVDEMQRLDAQKLSAAPKGAAAQGAIGLVFDFEQMWWYSILPQSERWNYVRMLQQWHGAITGRGLEVRVIRPGQKWPTDLKMVVAPALQMVDAALVKQFEDYASAGGHLVLTCRTALMDRHGQLFEGKTAQPILHLIGGEVEAYDSLPGKTMGKIEMDGQTYAWGVWGDLLYSEPTTRVLARYADQFYTGAAAVIQKRLGKGTVTYCGVAAERDFVDALLTKLLVPPVEASAAKRKSRRKEEPPPLPQPIVPMVTLPPRTQLARRGAYWVFLNFNDAQVEAPAPTEAAFVIGQRLVEPAGVAVWEDVSPPAPQSAPAAA